MTLQQAAVLGDDFWAEAVRQMNKVARFPLDETQVESALDALERRDMIFRAATPVFSGGRAYLFKHAVLREVAYESVLLRDRAAYHLQAARWLEAQSGDGIAGYAAPIAQHYELAGRAAEAARLYEIAAGRAAEEARVGQSIGYYRKVLELLRPMPQYLDTRLAVLDRLGRSLMQRGRLVEALDAYRMMHNEAELDGNLSVQARAENARAAIYLELGDAGRAAAATVRAEQLARLSGTDIELVWACLRQAESAGRMDNTEAAMAAARRGLEHSRLLDAPRETGRALALLAAYGPAANHPEEAERAREELTALAEALIGRDRLEDAADVLVSLGKVRHNSLPHGRVGSGNRLSGGSCGAGRGPGESLYAAGLPPGAGRSTPGAGAISRGRGDPAASYSRRGRRGTAGKLGGIEARLSVTGGGAQSTGAAGRGAAVSGVRIWPAGAR